jgi:hypothetical protein
MNVLKIRYPQNVSINCLYNASFFLQPTGTAFKEHFFWKLCGENKYNTLWNYPKTSFFMLTRARSPNFVKDCCFFVTFLFLNNLLPEKWPFSLKSLLLQVQTAMKL